MSETVRRVARNAGWLAIGEGAVKGALFLAAIIVARSTGPEGMGVFSIAFAAAILAVMVLAAGQQEVVIREVAATPGQAGTLLDAARNVQNRLGRWVLPALVVGALLIHQQDLRLALLAFIPYALLRTLLVTHGAAFKGLDRMDMEVRARGLEVMLVLPGLAAVGWAGLPVWTTGVVFSVGAGAALIWLAFRSRDLKRSARETGQEEHSSDIPVWRHFRHEGLPFLALAVASQLLARADTFLLAAFEVPHQEIGYYGAAGAPVWGIVALPMVLAVALYPTLSRRAAEGRSPLPAVAIAIIFGGIMGSALAVAINVWREPLVLLAFGSDFTPTVALLSRLLWVLPAKFVMTFLGLILAAWHRQHLALVAVGAVLVLSIGLNLIWIPTMGALGSANAAVAAHAAGVLILVAVSVTTPRSNGDHDGP